jgi:CheY-like chemotaxis protein
LEFVRTVRPDAVLLDLTLPDMDGTDVAAEIRASQELRSTILIAVWKWARKSDPPEGEMGA